MGPENRLAPRTPAAGLTRVCCQLGESKSVFKTVDEDEYADMVSKRRQDDFVENDGVFPPHPEQLLLPCISCFSPQRSFAFCRRRCGRRRFWLTGSRDLR